MSVPLRSVSPQPAQISYPSKRAAAFASASAAASNSRSASSTAFRTCFFPRSLAIRKMRRSATNLDWKVGRFPKAKSGQSYEIPLNDVAIAALKKLRERANGVGPVVRKPSGMEIHSCRKWFEKCLEKAGVADLCWHDLRHYVREPSASGRS